MSNRENTHPGDPDNAQDEPVDVVDLSQTAPYGDSDGVSTTGDPHPNIMPDTPAPDEIEEEPIVE